MHNRILYALTTLLIITAAPMLAADSLAQWRNDITFLSTELAKRHPRFQTCGLPGEIDSAARALSEQVRTRSDAQIVVGIQRLVAKVHDGHTLVVPVAMKRGMLFRLPFMLWTFDDGTFVVDAADRQLIGKKVMRIGALEVNEVFKRLEPYISCDNGQQMKWALPFYATLTDFLEAIGAVNERSTAVVTFGDGTQKAFAASEIDPAALEIKLTAPKSGPVPDYLRMRDSMFYVREVRPGVLYIAVNGMNDAPGRTLEQFGKELRNTLASYPSAVIDLRLNNGGEAMKADELLKTLIAYDVRGGQIAALIGRMTFSAAQTFTARIDQWTQAVFVGEPTGSSPNHYGNERSVKLPFSGLRVNVSSGYNQPITSRDTRTAIVPDVAAAVTSRDHFSGTDPVLNAALDALQKRGK